jgi:hypothetical protein
MSLCTEDYVFKFSSPCKPQILNLKYLCFESFEIILWNFCTIVMSLEACMYFSGLECAWISDIIFQADKSVIKIIMQSYECCNICFRRLWKKILYLHCLLEKETDLLAGCLVTLQLLWCSMNWLGFLWDSNSLSVVSATDSVLCAAVRNTCTTEKPTWKDMVFSVTSWPATISNQTLILLSSYLLPVDSLLLSFYNIYVQLICVMPYPEMLSTFYPYHTSFHTCIIIHTVSLVFLLPVKLFVIPDAVNSFT